MVVELPHCLHRLSMSGSNSMAALPLAADILQLIHRVQKICWVELAHCTKYVDTANFAATSLTSALTTCSHTNVFTQHALLQLTVEVCTINV